MRKCFSYPKKSGVRGKTPETPPTHNPPIFGVIKDAEHNYYCTKNQVGGLCVGGVSGTSEFLGLAVFTLHVARLAVFART